MKGAETRRRGDLTASSSTLGMFFLGLHMSAAPACPEEESFGSSVYSTPPRVVAKTWRTYGIKLE